MCSCSCIQILCLLCCTTHSCSLYDICCTTDCYSVLCEKKIKFDMIWLDISESEWTMRARDLWQRQPKFKYLKGTIDIICWVTLYLTFDFLTMRTGVTIFASLGERFKNWSMYARGPLESFTARHCLLIWRFKVKVPVKIQSIG